MQIYAVTLSDNFQWVYSSKNPVWDDASTNFNDKIMTRSITVNRIIKGKL